MAGTPRIEAVVLGGSAGGIEALERVLARLPDAFAAPVLVALHVSPRGVSVLPRILSRAGPLQAAHARHGEALVPGRVYVAPPNHHLVVDDHGVVLSRGPQENGHRPAIDPLFRSAARAFGARLAGVILSGALDDGAAGLAAVKAAGGVAVVQDPADAGFPAMPRHAMERVEVDHVMPAQGIGGLLAELADGSNGAAAGPLPAGGHRAGPNGAASALVVQRTFSCPDCGGVLQPQPAEGVLRCRVGHAWAANSLLAAQSDKLEEALWVVLRTLDDKVSLARSMAEAARARTHALTAERYESQAERYSEMAATIRDALDAGAAAGVLEDAVAAPPEDAGVADPDGEAEPLSAEAG